MSTLYSGVYFKLIDYYWRDREPKAGSMGKLVNSITEHKLKKTTFWHVRYFQNTRRQGYLVVLACSQVILPIAELLSGLILRKLLTAIS